MNPTATTTTTTAPGKYGMKFRTIRYWQTRAYDQALYHGINEGRSTFESDRWRALAGRDLAHQAIMMASRQPSGEVQSGSCQVRSILAGMTEPRPMCPHRESQRSGRNQLATRRCTRYAGHVEKHAMSSWSLADDDDDAPVAKWLYRCTACTFEFASARRTNVACPECETGGPCTRIGRADDDDATSDRLDSMRINPAPAPAPAAGDWIVMCRVSGGVTGTRVSALKSNGIVRRFATKADAQAAATETQRAMRGGGAAQFQYWPARADAQ